MLLSGLSPHQEKIPYEISMHLEEDEEKQSWKEIAKMLKNTLSDELYYVVSQNSYRWSVICDFENQRILQGYSNKLVECLTDKLRNPTENDLEIENFCIQKNIAVPSRTK
jgi:hypothetical protein